MPRSKVSLRKWKSDKSNDSHRLALPSEAGPSMAANVPDLGTTLRPPESPERSRSRSRSPFSSLRSAFRFRKDKGPAGIQTTDPQDVSTSGAATLSQSKADAQRAENSGQAPVASVQPTEMSSADASGGGPAACTLPTPSGETTEELRSDDAATRSETKTTVGDIMPANVAQDPPSIWGEVYESLDPEVQQWIGNISDTGDEKQASEIAELVRQKEDMYKGASPRLKIKDREFIWRDYANRVVTWVTTIGNISVSFAPAPAGPVWSALKVLLNAHVSGCEEMTALLGLAAKFLDIVRRGHVYRICFGLDQQLEKDEVKMGLRKTIVETYTHSLKLLFISYKRLGEGGCMQLLRALVDPHEIENTLSELEKLEVKLDRDVQACGIQLSSAANLQQQSLLGSLKQPLRRIDEDVRKCLREIEVSQQQKLLNSISNIRVHEHHAAKKDNRTKGTCEWLVEHETFLAWENSSWSSTLWLKGEIGVGKSFLTSNVIDRYLSVAPIRADSEHASSCTDEGFAFFYCDRSIPERQNSTDILRSLVAQLAGPSTNKPSIHPQIDKLCGHPDASRPALGIASCKEILIDLINTYPRSTLILDAFDECDWKSRSNLKIAFRHLVTSADKPVKIFVSSRPVKGFPRFKWAQLQWEQLLRSNHEADVLGRLDTLPNDLSAAYSEIYAALSDFDQKILRRAVVWTKWFNDLRRPSGDMGKFVPHAVRLHLVTTKSASGEVLRLGIDPDPVSVQSLEAICRHFLVRSASIWYDYGYPHVSVLEFLECHHADWFDRVDEHIGELIMLALQESLTHCQLPTDQSMSDWIQSGPPDAHDIMDARHMIQDIARDNWLYNAIRAHRGEPRTPTRQYTEALTRFLGGAHPQAVIPRHIDILRQLEQLNYFSTDDLSQATPIALACVAGSVAFLNEWTRKGGTARDEPGLLARGARGGSIAVCSRLIALGCNPNECLIDVSEDWGSTPLATGTQYGNVEVVKFLLKHGADPNAPRADDKLPPLAIASSNCAELVPILLDAGASTEYLLNGRPHSILKYVVNVSWLSPTTAMSMLERLLAAGADVNSDQDTFGSVLAYVASYGSLDLLKLLIELGADVNRPLRTGWYGSVLAAALLGIDCNIRIIKCLSGEHMDEWKQTIGTSMFGKIADARCVPLQIMRDLGYPALLVDEVERLRLAYVEDN
ncbi:uncharacterized protein VDAG_06885 [Verticillium dahliae VdLs.17]|uniref:Nephrocystin 3-like N-terminal domain-containing protein n=1 Tax=Verticillium dahliae (strain VdLs.17 / ATCC MYA-4575 / FGSC 10137) TaxID=498257 RepID=G2X9Q3_VERDV|nr:uncharacterized protein VDAG_06885 [Verticillium dahliae VdLs.17]EGY15721.1 hypothetical protein VDAG_06885 [Verticillium dahliae VdLs.17]